MATLERLPRGDLAEQLAASLGREKAEEAVVTAAERLGLQGDAYDRDQTLRILDLLAVESGLVGVVARFAKARVLLKFAGPKSQP